MEISSINKNTCMKTCLTLLFCVFSLTIHAQNNSVTYLSQSLTYIGVDYSFSEKQSGFGMGVDLSSTGQKGTGWKAGASFGIAWSPYDGELSSAYLRNEVAKQMEGSTLESFEAPDETDGGFVWGGKILFLYFFSHDNYMAIGPRVNYFTGQEISVTTVSSDGRYEYTEFSQVPYLDPVLVPGLEINLSPEAIKPFEFRYSYMFMPEGQGAMHMIGLGITLH